MEPWSLGAWSLEPGASSQGGVEAAPSNGRSCAQRPGPRLTAAAGHPGNCSSSRRPQPPGLRQVSGCGLRLPGWLALAFLSEAGRLRGRRPWGPEAGALAELGSRGARVGGYGSIRSQQLLPRREWRVTRGRFWGWEGCRLRSGSKWAGRAEGVTRRGARSLGTEGVPLGGSLPRGKLGIVKRLARSWPSRCDDVVVLAALGPLQTSLRNSRGLGDWDMVDR